MPTSGQNANASFSKCQQFKGQKIYLRGRFTSKQETKRADVADFKKVMKYVRTCNKNQTFMSKNKWQLAETNQV